MSSTDRSYRSKMLMVALVFGVACASSLSFSSSAKAQTDTIRAQQVPAASTVEVALVGAAIAAYGWVADKTYDLGKEVGKWLAGSTPQEPAQAMAMEQGRIDYLLN
ncbi:MAG: hypothetical protein KC431_23755 [Myxococcales bacterium]|nr:hypothetical protein [Myxococcales bacterium]MCA9700563.1 hypothetical protein [Myxococcales bacterium]